MSLPEKCHHGVEAFHKDRVGPYVVASACPDCRRFVSEVNAVYNSDLAEETAQITRLVGALATAFPSFGGGKTSAFNPIVNMTKDDPPSFGAMVPIEAVVRFVLERVWRREERPDLPWSEEVHRERHVELHKRLDEVVADWIYHTKRTPSTGSVMDLLVWSSSQTTTPTPSSEDPVATSDYLARHPEMLDDEA